MHLASLELWGSILNFAGGALLSYDPLYAKRRVFAESGAKFFLQVARRLKLKNLKTAGGQPVDSEENLQIAAAERSETLARYGFLIMTIGFLLDLLAKSRSAG